MVDMKFNPLLNSSVGSGPVVRIPSKHRMKPENVMNTVMALVPFSGDKFFTLKRGDDLDGAGRLPWNLI